MSQKQHPSEQFLLALFEANLAQMRVCEPTEVPVEKMFREISEHLEEDDE